MENEVVIGKYKYRLNGDNILVNYNGEWRDIPKDYLGYSLLLNEIKASSDNSNRTSFFEDVGNKILNLFSNSNRVNRYLSTFSPIMMASPSGMYSVNNINLSKLFTNQIARNILGEETYNDIKGIMTDPYLSFFDRIKMFKYGFLRKFLSNYEGDDMSEKARNTEIVEDSPKKTSINLFPDSTVLSQTLKNASYNISNDTTFWYNNRNHRLFSVPRSINLSGLKLGHRNRGDKTPFEARDIISTYKPIFSYEEGVRNGRFKLYDSEGHINEFLGYDSEGNFKIGTFDKFGPGDTMSLVYYGYLRDIPRDENGDPYLVRAGKDSRRLSPKYIGHGEPKINQDGTISYPEFGEESFLLMTPKKDWRIRNHSSGLDLFNNVEGGGYILNVDDEYRLVRGSINNVLDEVEKMKVNHKGKDVKLYLVDNGSYNRGLMTRDNVYTGADLHEYETLTHEAGHFFYIKPEGFPILRKGGKLLPRNTITRFKNKI